MRPYLICRTAAVALSLGLAAAPPASGQSTPRTIALSKECEQALRLAVQGHLRREEDEQWDRKHGGGRSKTDWMWAILPHCGKAGGVAGAGMWTATRAVSDTTRLAETYAGLWRFRDAAVFNAAVMLAADPSATTPSRVFSTMLLVAQLFDQLDPAYREFIATGRYDVCRIGGVVDRSISLGAPLPADARMRARTLARALVADPGAPRDVQNAGRCLDQAIEIEDAVDAAGPIAAPPDP
jgi:hypothetical protein